MESNMSSAGVVSVDLAAVFHDLVRVQIRLWDRLDRRLRRDHDLPLSWCEPMQVIDRTPGCRVADIARDLSITVGGTSKLVDRIERAGWCRRTANPDDARSSVLGLTAAGREVLARAVRSFDDELNDALGAAVPAGHLEVLARTLRTIHIRLEGAEV